MLMVLVFEMYLFLFQATNKEATYPLEQKGESYSFMVCILYCIWMDVCHYLALNHNL